jgi:hypothetical protein
MLAGHFIVVVLLNFNFSRIFELFVQVIIFD